MSAAGIDTELRTVIAEGAAQLGVDLDAGQIERLVDYLQLIDRWNATYNLTAVRDLRAMATQHILDSLSVIPTLRRLRQVDQPFRILDVGSGAGLPGVVVAVAMPETVVTCVDSVGKKAAFITHAAASLALANLTSIKARVEDVRSPPAYDVIVSRAFASLRDFVMSTRHLRMPAGQWLAMKGKVPVEELADIQKTGASFDLINVRIPGLNADRCLLIGKASANSAKSDAVP